MRCPHPTCGQSRAGDPYPARRPCQSDLSVAPIDSTPPPPRDHRRSVGQDPGWTGHRSRSAQRWRLFPAGPAQYLQSPVPGKSVQAGAGHGRLKGSIGDLPPAIRLPLVAGRSCRECAPARSAAMPAAAPARSHAVRPFRLLRVCRTRRGPGPGRPDTWHRPAPVELI